MTGGGVHMDVQIPKNDSICRCWEKSREEVLKLWNKSQAQFWWPVDEQYCWREGGLTFKSKTFKWGKCRNNQRRQFEFISVNYQQASTMASAACFLQVTVAWRTGFIQVIIHIRLVPSFRNAHQVKPGCGHWWGMIYLSVIVHLTVPLWCLRLWGFFVSV